MLSSYKNKEVKKVCAVDTVHGLLQYLLLNTQENIKQTFFFFGIGIPEEFKQAFQYQSVTIPPRIKSTFRSKIDKIPVIRNIVEKLEYFVNYRITYPLRWSFLLNENIEYWGMCHLCYSNYVLRNHKYYMVEDGMLNYNMYPYNDRRHRFNALWHILLGKNYGIRRTFAGSEENCIKIHLTGIREIKAAQIRTKAVIQTMDELWHNSELSKRRFINSVFGVDYVDTADLSRYDSILLMQPCAMDGILSDEEEYDAYSWIIKHIPSKKLVIKPHPRDKRYFKKLYPGIKILNTKAPMELLALNGIRFKYAYTITSTAAFLFPYPIKVAFIGHRVHPIFAISPLFTKDSIKSNNPNITLIDFPERKYE